MKTLVEYSKEEVARFDEMHEILKEYNKRVQEGDMKPFRTPPFNSKQMMEYSRYRELLMSNEAKICGEQ
jgi:hypothetical protein